MSRSPEPADRSGGRKRAKQFAGNRISLWATAVLLATVIFLVDLSLPLGVAGGVPYVALVLLGWRLDGPRYIVGLAAVATLLTVAGYFLSPEGGIAWMVLINRALALFAIWVTAVLLYRAKRAESRVRAARDTLELRVEDRTAELRAAQTALLRKERLAAMGQLTGTVAHELRNPLGTIATSVHVVRHKCGDPDLGIEKALDRAERGLKRCDAIVTELLDFARAKGVQPEPIALDAWLSALLDEQDVPGGITLVRDLQTGGAVVRFDPEALRRALINLVENACQAMTDGGGARADTAQRRLTVASRVAGGRVEIVVADTGPGIPEEVLPQVLEPLFSTKPFGTGLGLPTVQRTLEDHGGGIEIDSEPGRGTRVRLWLPHAQANR